MVSALYLPYCTVHHVPHCAVCCSIRQCFALQCITYCAVYCMLYQPQEVMPKVRWIGWLAAQQHAIQIGALPRRDRVLQRRQDYLLAQQQQYVVRMAMQAAQPALAAPKPSASSSSFGPPPVGSASSSSSAPAVPSAQIPAQGKRSGSAAGHRGHSKSRSCGSSDIRMAGSFGPMPGFDAWSGWSRTRQPPQPPPEPPAVLPAVPLPTPSIVRMSEAAPMAQSVPQPTCLVPYVDMEATDNINI